MCPSGTTITASAESTCSTDSKGFRSAFDVLDADRDGKIGSDDLRVFYSALAGAGADESAIGSMISAADSNHDGFVEFDEFERVLGAGEAAGASGVMEDVFRVMDKDRDGKLSHADLKSYMNSAGFAATDEDIAAMIALAAAASGGDDCCDHDHVSFQGFLKILAVDRVDFDSV